MNHRQFISQLSQLVASPSVSCTVPEWDQGNEQVINLLAEWLEDLGFSSVVQAIDGYPGKFNLLASKGRGERGLVLAGHSDTVPCNPSAWAQDPFALTQKDNRLFGLGASDMKGFFPVVLAALEHFRDVAFEQPVMVLATADEESSMCGARQLAAAAQPLGRYTVIGEPTSMRPVRMHKGIMMESLKVTGLAGHSSNPALGKNALEVMNLIMSDLLAFRTELQSRFHNPNFSVTVPTLNLGCIHGGDNPNRICQQCELHFDLRPLPGMSNDELREAILARVQPIADAKEVKLEFTPLFPGIDPYEQEAESALVQIAEELTGASAEAVAFATEAPFFKGLGMETIIMGPGSINQAHQPNEFIELDQIAPAVNTLRNLIGRLCVNPSKV